MATITCNTDLVFESMTCYLCGTQWGMLERLVGRARQLGKDVVFYCPNGHGQCFTESECNRLRKEKESLTARLDQERASTRDLKAANARLVSDKQRLRNRAAHGVCPCCHRSFVNMAKHMKTKHPKFQ
jgi:hypothetical protein